MAPASILSTTCPGNTAGSEVFGRYRFYPRAGVPQWAHARGRLLMLSPPEILPATALFHEAYIRFVEAKDQRWQSRAHFFKAEI
jgi:hypothetical protein